MSIKTCISLQISRPTMQGNKDDYHAVLSWVHECKVCAVTDYIMIVEYNHETKNLANRITVDEAGEVIKSIMRATRTIKRKF